jgi:peroxiredoxin
MSFSLLSMTFLKRFGPLALAFAIAALILGVTAQRMFAGGIREAPEVRFSTLKGELLNMSDLRGRVVLVNFWATSCAPCVKEMPRLAAIWNRYQARGFDTIAVAMDYDPPNLVADFARRFNLPFRVAYDPRGEIAMRFGKVRAIPASFVVGRQGQIVFHQEGELDFARLDAVLEAALREPPT